MEYKNHYFSRMVRHWAAGPFIYAVFFPILFLDLIIEIFHRLCFPLYGLAYVRRGKYIKIDRHKLAYLTVWQKFHCLYCGYANGVLRYAAEIAQRTEWYWCGIMHEQSNGYIMPKHQRQFLKYGDEKSYDEYMEVTGAKRPPQKRSRKKKSS